MTDPRLRVVGGDRLEAEVRHPHIAHPLNGLRAPEPAPANSTSEEGRRGPDEDVGMSNSTRSGERLAEFGNRFAGLIRVLDDIRQVSEGLPDTDVDAMTRPVLAVLKGVMARIIGAPATTIVDLGIKAQVVMWANQDWWEEDAPLSWQTVATRALVEQTIAAAGLIPPLASRSPSAEELTG